MMHPPFSFSSFQHYVATLMQTITHTNLSPNLLLSNQRYTDNDLGTTVVEWTNVMNNFIRERNLNFGRQYSINEIIAPYGIRNIENIVRSSLENNTPVALAYRGNLPQNFSLNSGIDNHFIIIYGIYGVLGANMHVVNSDSALTFRYMDPWTGTTGTFDASSIRTLISNSLTSYLISYNNSNVLTENQISRPNEIEFMNIGMQRLNLSSMTNLNTNLGSIVYNSERVIIQSFLFNNQNLPSELANILRVRDITHNSAVVYVPEYNLRYQGEVRVTFYLNGIDCVTGLWASVGGATASGAAAGAMVGSAVPGAGTVIGGGAGALVGGLIGLLIGKSNPNCR